MFAWSRWLRWLRGRRTLHCPGPRLVKGRGPIAVLEPGRRLRGLERTLVEQVAGQVYGLASHVTAKVQVRLANQIYGRQGERLNGMTDLSGGKPTIFLRQEGRSDALLLLDEIGHVWLWSRRQKQSHAMIYGSLKTRFAPQVEELFRDLGYTWRARLWLRREIERRARLAFRKE